MKKNYLVINYKKKISEALIYLKKNGQKCLVVSNDKGKLFGTLSDGDIRNYILKSNNLNLPVSKISNIKPKFIYNSELNKKKLNNLFIKNRISLIPIIGSNNKILQVLTKEDIKRENFNTINVAPIFIMAGGKGVRLKPFTDILPKPLIPINGIPIIQIIINKFNKILNGEIYISLNYKDKLMKSYLSDFKEKYGLHFISEKKPLGTIGSIKLLDKISNDNIIVTNCDVIINHDYNKILKFHIQKKFDFTLVAVKKKFQMQYGILKFNNNILDEIEEKPTFNFSINGGFYILKKELVNKIPKNKRFDLDNLINLCLKNNLKIGVYEIPEKEWNDIGEWDEYKKTISKLKF